MIPKKLSLYRERKMKVIKAASKLDCINERKLKLDAQV